MLVTAKHNRTLSGVLFLIAARRAIIEFAMKDKSSYYSTMNKSVYETRSGRVLRDLQEDLIEKKLTQQEFEILLGYLVEKEFADNIKYQLKFILPKRSI